MINVDWITFKSFVLDRNIPIECIVWNQSYNLWAFDSSMYLTSQIKITDPSNADQQDFETNYKNASNKHPNEVITGSFRVIE